MFVSLHRPSHQDGNSVTEIYHFNISKLFLETLYNVAMHTGEFGHPPFNLVSAELSHLVSDC